MLYLELIKTLAKLLLLEKTTLSMWKNVPQLTHMLQFSIIGFSIPIFSSQLRLLQRRKLMSLSLVLTYCTASQFYYCEKFDIPFSLLHILPFGLIDFHTKERSNATEIQTILRDTNTKFISVFYSDLLFLSWSCHLAARAEKFCSHLLSAMLSHFL